MSEEIKKDQNQQDNKKPNKRGRKATGKTKESTTVSLEKGLKAAIDDLCELHDFSFTSFIEDAAREKLLSYENNEVVNIENKIVIPYKDYEEMSGFTQSAIVSKVKSGALEEANIKGHKCILIPTTDKLANFFKIALLEKQQGKLDGIGTKIIQENYELREKSVEQSETIEQMQQKIEELLVHTGLKDTSKEGLIKDKAIVNVRNEKGTDKK